MSSASWDGFTYFTNDPGFLINIAQGTSEPYGSRPNLDIVKQYVAAHPDRIRTMIDVGAHIGTTALPYSRIFSRVIGYEPTKENYDFCVQNITHNDVTNVFVENCAILDRHVQGTPTFHNADNTGCIFFKEDTTGTIATKILDEEGLSEVDFIKIDTEGAEVFVIRSALQLITKWKPLIQAELCGLSEKNFNVAASDLLELLRSLGYRNLEGTDFFIHSEFLF